jgi:hypothetical protein
MWFWATNGTLPAILATAAVGIFLACFLGCRGCRRNKEDPIFRHRDR